MAKESFAASTSQSAPTAAPAAVADQKLTPAQQAERDAAATVLPQQADAHFPPPTGNGGSYVVSWAQHTATIYARDANEAWAIFCDGIKAYPPRKTGKVVKV